MNSGFSSLDWFVFGAYFLVLAISSYLFSQFKIRSSRDYFVSSNTMPMLAVAVSIVATSQSAATFWEFRNFLMCKKTGRIDVFTRSYHGKRCQTLHRCARCKYDTFFRHWFFHMLVAITLLLTGALAYTYFGGIKSIIFSDVIQALTYIGAGILVFWYLYLSLHNVDILAILQTHNKLHVIDTSLDGKFNILALFSGWLLLNIAAFGLDQDMTQRVLSCKNKNEATKSLILSILFTIPIVLLFLGIGALLFLCTTKQAK